MLLHKRARRAVKLAVVLGPLQKFSAVHHLQKLRPIGEEIIDTIPFASSRLTCRMGDRKFQIVKRPEKVMQQRGFPRTRGGRDDVNVGTHPTNDTFYSIFCTCSRNFSISILISIAAWPIAAPRSLSPEVFDSVVVTSRFIS